MEISIKLFRFLFLPVIFYLLVFLFPLSQAQAATLTSVSDTLTTSRPSASAPLASDLVVSYNTVTQDGTGDVAQSNSASSLTFSHTVGTQSNMILIVGVSTQSQTVSSVKYNGTSMIQLNETNCPGGGNGPCLDYLFYLKSPSSGTHNVLVTLSGTDQPVAGAVSFYNVDQTNTFGTVATNTGIVNSGQTTLLVVTSNGSQLVIDSLATDNQGGVTVDASQAQLWSDGCINQCGSGSSKTGGASSTTMKWKETNANNNVAWADIGVPLNPTASTPVTQATIVDNGSIYLASDSATLNADIGETLDSGLIVASMSAANTPSAGQRVVSFSSTAGHAHHMGDALTVANTAMHTVQFTTINAVPTLGKITVAFPSLRTGDSNLAASPSASTFQLNGLSDSNVKINGLSGAGTFTGTYTNPANGTSPTITLALTGTTTIPASTTITILIGCLANSGVSCTNQAPRIINPTKTAAAGTADSWQVIITTRDFTNSVDLDTSKIRIGTVESITVTGNIDSTFTFTIAGVPDGTPLNTGSYCGVNHNTDTTNSGISTTATNVNLGTLSNSASNSAAQSMNVQTNAINGYAITATSSGAFINPGNGYQIRNAQGAVTSNDTPVPALMNTGTAAFGIHACDANGKVSIATWGTGGDKFANPSSSFYYTLVNSSVQPAALGDTIVVLYRATASGITPAGLYREVITYVATPVF